MISHHDLMSLIFLINRYLPFFNFMKSTQRVPTVRYKSTFSQRLIWKKNRFILRERKHCLYLQTNLTKLFPNSFNSLTLISNTSYIKKHQFAKLVFNWTCWPVVASNYFLSYKSLHTLFSAILLFKKQLYINSYTFNSSKIKLVPLDRWSRYKYLTLL